MLPRLSLIIGLLVLLALPATAGAASNQSMTFEAPRELLDPSTRDRALDEIRAFGVDRVRVLVYWQSYAPAPKAKKKPAFDATDPAAYPAGTWDSLDALFAAAAARGIAVQLTLTGPVPKWATASKKDNVTKPSPKEFQAFATAVGRRYGDRVGLWSIWNEPNHPQFLKPQFVHKKAKSPRIYRKLFLAGQRGLARVRQRRRHAAVRRDRAARHPARRRAARVPARRAVPQPLLPPQGPLRADLGRRLRPPRLHDPHRPALPPAGQGRRDDRRPVAALQRARPRPAGRARSRAGSAST